MSSAALDRPGAGARTWARSALDLLSDVPGVRRVGLALVEGGGRRLSFTASDRGRGDDADWCGVDAFEDVPLNNTVRTGRLIHGSLTDLAARYPEFVGRQDDTIRAFASVPLTDAGRLIGGYALFYESGQSFDRAQLDQLRRLGERLGAARRRSRLDETTPRRPFAADPVPAGAQVASHLVAGDLHDVAVARQFVRSTLTGWGVDGDPVDVAVLCVSELVTNAIIHTEAGCEVRLLLHRGVVTAGVRDSGPAGGRASAPGGDPLAVHGRGLRLVEALCARWGSERDVEGLTVWCEIEIP